MCGIIGLTLFKKNKETKKQRQTRSKIMRSVIFDCIENSTSRGRDATGIAFVTNKEWVCMKQPVDADDFFIEKHQEEGTNLREFIKKWDETTGTIKHVLAHVRASTQGSKYDPENNHPLIMKEEDRTILGIHNGTINNDAELTKEYSLTREAEVDSEVIFRLADKLASDQSKGFSKESFSNLLKLLKGNFAIMTVSNKDKNTAWFAVHGRPLNIFYIPETHSAVYISESRFLHKAIEQHNKMVYRGDGELLLTAEESFKSVANKFFYVHSEQTVESAKDIMNNIQPMEEEKEIYKNNWSGNYKETKKDLKQLPAANTDKNKKSKPKVEEDGKKDKIDKKDKVDKKDEVTTTTCDDMPMDSCDFEHDFEENLDEFYDLIDEGRDYLSVLETGNPLGDADGGELFYDTNEYQKLMVGLEINKADVEDTGKKELLDNLKVVLETSFAQGYAYGYINSENYLFGEKDEKDTESFSKEEFDIYKDTLIKNQRTLVNKLTKKVTALSEALRDVLRQDLSYQNARKKSIGIISKKELKQALKTAKEYTTN